MRVPRTLVLLAVVTFAIAGLSGALAQGFKMPDEGTAERLMDHIGVSGQQREELRAIHSKFALDSTQFTARVATSQDALADAIHDDVFDEEVIRNAAAQLADTRADEYVAQARMMHEVRGVLTPDQYDKLKTAHGLMRHGHKASHGPHGGPATN